MVFPATTVFAIETLTPFSLNAVHKGDRFQVRVLEVNPRHRDSPTSVANLPIYSNMSGGPSGLRLEAVVVDVKDILGKKTASVLFDQLIARDGTKKAFLGGISLTEDIPNLPRWVDDGHYQDESHSSAMESMAVVLPWAADLGPIGIGAAVVLTRMHQARRNEVLDLRRRIRAALSFIEGDVPARSIYYVVSTRDASY